jgi:hypothetical protein
MVVSRGMFSNALYCIFCSYSVLRIRDVTIFFQRGSQIQIFFHPGSALKNLSILTQKLFLSSRKYDQYCSSRIRILIFLPIPGPGFRGQKSARSRICNAAGIMLVSSCKNSKKNLDSYYFVTLFDFISSKNDVASKSNKQKKLLKKNLFSPAS